MKTSDIIGIKKERAKKIWDEILESCRENDGEEFGRVIIYIMNRYRRKDLLYAMLAIGFILGGIDARD